MHPVFYSKKDHYLNLGDFYFGFLCFGVGVERVRLFNVGFLILQIGGPRGRAY